MKKNGQPTQTTFSFPDRKNSDSSTGVSAQKVVCLNGARRANEIVKAKKREKEVVSKILKASRTLNW